MDPELVLRTIDRWSEENASFFYRPGLGRLVELDHRTDSRAYVLDLSSFYEERSLVPRSEPYRGEPLTPGHFEGLWSIEVLPQKLYEEEARELVVPGSEEVSSCVNCGGDGRVRCSRCNGDGIHTCAKCDGKKLLTCGSCHGQGRVNCGSCSCGEATCSSCGGRGINSSDSRSCQSCNGRGKCRCGNCNGRGERECGTCSGNRKVKCSGCSGSGTVLCGSCCGRGYNTCPPCEGVGKIRTWTALNVHFRPLRKLSVIGNGAIPEKELWDDRGDTLVQEAVQAFTHLPAVQPEIDRVAEGMFAEHALPPGDPGRRLLRQQYEVRDVPVTAVLYHLRSKPGFAYELWIHGEERAVWAEHVPRGALLDWRAVHFVAVLCVTIAWCVLLWTNAAQLGVSSGLSWEVLAGIGGMNTVCAGIYVWMAKRWDWEDRGGERRRRPKALPLWLVFAYLPTLLHALAVPVLFNNPANASRLLSRIGIIEPAAPPEPIKPLVPPQLAAESHFQKALVAREAGDFLTAARECAESVQLNPRYVEAHYLLAHCRLMRGMRVEAEESFNRVISMAPRSAEAAESRKALARLHPAAVAPAAMPAPQRTPEASGSASQKHGGPGTKRR